MEIEVDGRFRRPHQHRYRRRDPQSERQTDDAGRAREAVPAQNRHRLEVPLRMIA